MALLVILLFLAAFGILLANAGYKKQAYGLSLLAMLVFFGVGFAVLGQGIEKQIGKDVNAVDANLTVETLNFTNVQASQDIGVFLFGWLFLFLGFVELTITVANVFHSKV